MQYKISREAVKISSLSSGKTSKYEYLIGQEILPPQQYRIIGETKFADSLLGKTFEKQTKTFEKQRKKQILDLPTLDPNNQQI